MIIEGIVTTLEPDGGVNISPMGPLLDRVGETIELRPYSGSRTLFNLAARPHGVFHRTDDALLIVMAVTKRWVEPPRLEPALAVPGWVLPDCCGWHEFVCGYVDQSANRAVVKGKIVHSSEGRGFTGFNRARHALLEAAVVISRVQFLPMSEIQLALETAAKLVEKTGGDRERLALEVLQAHLSANQSAEASPSAVPEEQGTT